MYKAPVEDIAFTLKHVAGMSEAIAGGLFGDLSEDLADAILAEAGLGVSNVVRINAFVTDRAHLPAYMDVRNRLFAEPAPASTLVIVSGFARPEFKVEVEVTAAG